MKGFGPSSQGGSFSSSSNLSPLAPPFKVDPSLSKTKLNPLGPFVEPHYIEAPHHFLGFGSSHENWSQLHSLHSPTSVPNSFNNPNPGIDPIGAMGLPSEGAYGQPKPNFYGPQSVSRPYFPEYPSATMHHKSPVTINEPRCDMLSSGTVPLGPGGGFWNGMSGEEQGRRKARNEAGSSAYSSSLNQEIPAADGLTICEDTSAVWLGKCVDSLARKCHVGSKGIDFLDAKFSSAKEDNTRVTPFNMSRTSVSDPASLFQEMPYPQVPSSGSVLKSWSQLNPNTASYERCFTDLDSCTTNPTVFYPSSIYSSLAHVYDSPAISSSSTTLEKTIFSKNVNPIEQPWDACDSKQDSATHTLKNIKEPCVLVMADGKEGYGDTSRTSNGIEVNDQFFVDPFPMKMDFSSNSNPITDESLNYMFKANFKPPVTDLNLPDVFTLVHTAAGACDSEEGPSEMLDQCNPIVDSPCWKGASASRHSPFAKTEAVAPQLVKKSQGFNGLNLQGTQILPVNADEVVTFSSPEVRANLLYCENGSGEDGSSYFPKSLSSDVSLSTEKNEQRDAFKAGSDRSKLNNENVIQCFLPGNSKNCSEIKSCQMMKLSCYEDNDTTARQLATEVRVADPRMDAKDAAQYGSSHVPFQDREHFLRLPSGDSVPNELVEPLLGKSDTLAECQLRRIDVRMLVNLMQNLSELLLASCKDANALKEQDQEVLQHVINNIDACVSKVGLMKPIPHMGKATGRSPGTNIEAKDVKNQYDSPNAFERKMDSTLYRKKEDKFQHFAAPSDDTDFEQDNDMTQAIKKVLMENLQSEEEPHPQTSLFKNLWLEAEAALFSMAFKGRFARMKIKMEERKQHQTKDVGMPINVEKLPSSKISVDLNRDDKVASKTKGVMTPDIPTQDTSQSSNASCAEDVVASVMDRYRILKCRVDNSISVNKEGQLLDPVDEAEAAFCSMEDKAHSARMRIEMENCKQHQAIGMPINMEELPSSKVFLDLNGDDIAASKSKGSMTPNFSRQDTSQSSCTSIAESFEASVMDRFRILKCRVENAVSVNKEGQLPDPCEIEACPEKETMFSLREGSVQDIGMEPHLTELVGLGFSEKRETWPFIRMRTNDGTSEVSNVPHVDHHREDYTVNGTGLDLDVFEQQESVKEFCISISDEPEIEFYSSERLGTWLQTGGYDSPSSDWEHVLKEELAWLH